MVEQNYQRQFDTHERRLNAHSDEIRDLELWRAKVGGFLTAIGLVVGTGMGVPAFILAVLALTGRIG